MDLYRRLFSDSLGNAIRLEKNYVLSQNPVHQPNFTDFGIIDARQISTDFGLETSNNVSRDFTDLFWPSSVDFRPFLAAFIFGFSSALLLNLRASRDLKHICPTSPTSSSPIPATYWTISVWRVRIKSVGTLQTFSDFLPTISDRFHFRFFGHICAQFWCGYTFEPWLTTGFSTFRQKLLST